MLRKSANKFKLIRGSRIHAFEKESTIYRRGIYLAPVSRQCFEF